MSCNDENVSKGLGDGSQRSQPIRVLLIKNGVPKRAYTVDAVGVEFKELRMVQSICQHPDIFKEIMGIEMIDKSVFRVSAIHSPSNPSNDYILEMKSPMVRTKVQVTLCNDSRYNYTLAIDSPKSKLFEFEKFNKLLLTDRFSDVTLCVDDKHVPAHKAILANRSPVFDALLKTETKKLRLTNIEHKTLLDLLTFVYKGYLNDDDGRDLFIKYSNLLKADRKYFVNCLKELCEEKLCFCIDFDNVLDCLILSESCNAFKLKQSAIAFFVEHRKRIVEMSSYDNFAILNPQILCRLLKDVALEQINAA